MGFVLNPYDHCVANKEINGSMCTIVFYVDDNKISHKDPQVVRSVVESLKGHFGELTVTEGKKFDFLGMNITIRDDKKIEIEMKDQINEAINWIGEEVNHMPKTPANRNLFSVDENSVPLGKEKSDTFHSVVAKLLYISKRGRPDIEVAVSFLCRRVSKSTEEDWLKLSRILGYLKGTINEVRIIGAVSLRDLYMWVDAAYGVHSDMRSHTGGTMSFGHGVVHHKSSVQKLNTKSSTESELVGTSEYLPYNIWLKNFMSTQGYDIKDNILFQDNQSAIKMENNGKRSCTGNSRHINIRHFFVKDRIDKKEVRVEYCPTGIMLADYFIKPLQGRAFKIFRDVIMDYRHISILKEYQL